jgi:hypothetical protein
MKRIHCAACLTQVMLTLCFGVSAAADPQPGAVSPAIPPVKEEELQRAVRAVSNEFPWVKTPKKSGQPPPVPKPGGEAGAMPDMSSGDIIIREMGDFSAAPGATPDKQCLKLTKDVIVETLNPRSVLRAQKFIVTRDLKTSSTDLMEAFGSVEMFMPEQKGKGEFLHYETRYGANGEVVKDLFTLEGSRADGKRAYLWLGTDADPDKNDKIEADKFVNDRRLNTFRALGNPAAVVSMPGPQAPAPGKSSKSKKADKNPETSIMPNMSGFTAGGLSRLQCEGEMFFEGASGRLTLMRNAVIQQEGQPDTGSGAAIGAGTGIKLSSDEAHLIMDVPPPGQPDSNAGMFGGDLKTIECIGRVEMKTATHVVLCDRCTIDVQHTLVLMEMKNPKEDVRIFIKDDTGGRAFSARKSFTYNMSTSDIQSPYGGMKTEALPAVIPTNRPPPGKQPAPAPAPGPSK